MKTTLRNAILVALLATISLSGESRGELVTAEEAEMVAENYVRLILEKDGSWGGQERVNVGAVEPFLRGETLLGYYCPVEPVGYFVLGLYRELAPIRAYSTRSNLDPTLEIGMTDLLKDRLETLYASIERTVGRPINPNDDFASILPASFRGTWDRLSDPGFDPTPFRQDPPGVRSAGMNYQEGETLLETGWHQQPPYNNECPDLGLELASLRLGWWIR
jgi:hypothetical protein